MATVTDTSPNQPSTPRWRKWLLPLGGVLVGVTLGLLVMSWLAGRPLFGPPQFHGTLIQSPQPAANFTLTGPNGQPVTLRDFRGEVVMLYFGYTFCPDACPATLVELNQALELLGRRAEDVQVIMISIDPERDTPQKLAEYVSHFNDDFLGITGIEEELLGVTTQYGVYYQKHEGTAASGYLIDHTVSVLVIDKSGHLRLVYPFNTPAEDIAADLRYLVRD